MPRALETDELPGLLAEYRHVARAARRADFDGVELHTANSYLLDQLTRDSVNHPTPTSTAAAWPTVLACRWNW